MGCGSNGRVAIALKSMAKFFMGMKADYNYPRRSTAWIDFFSLSVVPEDFSQFIDPSYMNILLTSDSDGTYQLATGAYVHLGYEIMAMFGPTRSLLIS